VSGLPPIRLHVGDDEVLLDDSRRYGGARRRGGRRRKLDVWMEMPHGFVTGIYAKFAVRDGHSRQSEPF